MAWRLLGGFAAVLALAASVAGAEDPTSVREAGLALARGQIDQAVALYTAASGQDSRQ